MADGAGVLYADTSALVKLLVHESESAAVERELDRWQAIATSSITSIELGRAVMRARAASRASVADEAALRGVLGSLAEVPLSNRVRVVATTLAPPELRTLDAIHLASALELGIDLGGLLSYDARLAAAAAGHGVTVIAPA